MLTTTQANTALRSTVSTVNSSQVQMVRWFVEQENIRMLDQRRTDRQSFSPPADNASVATSKSVKPARPNVSA